MHNDPNWGFIRALFGARIERLKNLKHQDRGALSIETLMIVAGLVVVAGIAVAVITVKVNEKKATIK
ncbi:hypothetical protein [Streptomyces sp. MZ04]|uniref:hypothetical protein n=1 Tax=Streptomyces sp. MZ04 TaxID=2559236 RepID=UPI00107E9B69|nr:hypothetical protein [Streptomyces sp. MZ04]TGB15517.1 hypothetical protein E2651_02540 [Streptomyces sp. MZ04]